MSSEPLTLTETVSTWPVLGLHERRVLGVLVEKAKTTPDVYPLSVNAIVAGCNQKSNRDPLLNMAEEEQSVMEMPGPGADQKWRRCDGRRRRGDGKETRRW